MNDASRTNSSSDRRVRWHARREATVTNLLRPVRRLLGPRGPGTFGILMYHRVTPRIAGVPEPTWNVTPDRFRAQLAGLLKRGYEAWPLRRALAHAEAGEPVPRNVFVITFDDGYENNYVHAWPVLREMRLPATIFLATAYLDTGRPFPSDDWSAAGDRRVTPESWKPMTSGQCARMHALGLVELAAHTHTHADFRGRPADLAADLRVNVRELEERFGIVRPSFAFPYGTKRLGYAGGAMTEAVRHAGVRCALTTEDVLVDPHHDCFDWGRFTAHQHDTAATLAVKLDGWFTWVRELRRRGRTNGRGMSATIDVAARGETSVPPVEIGSERTSDPGLPIGPGPATPSPSVAEFEAFVPYGAESPEDFAVSAADSTEFAGGEVR